MLQLQEPRKKRNHLFPNPATFVGFRCDSETQFFSRELREGIGGKGRQNLHPFPNPSQTPRTVKAPPAAPPVCGGHRAALRSRSCGVARSRRRLARIRGCGGAALLPTCRAFPRPPLSSLRPQRVLGVRADLARRRYRGS